MSRIGRLGPDEPQHPGDPKQAAPETHTLKLWPAYFQAKLEGRKPWEDRSTADRFFREGDTVIFREWDPQAEIYTGRVIGPERITYCLNQPQHEGGGRAIFTHAPARKVDGVAELASQLDQTTCEILMGLQEPTPAGKQRHLEAALAEEVVRRQAPTP